MASNLHLASVGATSDRIEGLVVAGLDRPARILDLGCGSGHFSRRLKAHYEARGWDVATHLTAADIDLSGYGVPEVPAVRVDLDEGLPFADGSFDVIVAVEVMEHVAAPYVVLRDLHRVLAPGGRLVFSTPNVANIISRLLFLASGHFRLYPTPSTDPALAGSLSGHIQPLPPQYWHYGLRRAGFADIALTADRRKKGATILAALLRPLTLWGDRLNRRIMGRSRAPLAEVEGAMVDANSFETQTSRCLVFTARRG
jgi:SAM-dependent methyltransferase